jgi:hypothetical protein
MEETPRLSLPLLSAGQSLKELFHNESLSTLDLLIGGTIEPGIESAPPVSPVATSFYRIGASATGAWAGHDGELAVLGINGWQFCVPVVGLRLTERISGLEWHFDELGWQVGRARVASVSVGGKQVVGPRAAAILAPSGGTTIDHQARACLNAVLDALRGHGLIET